MGVLPFRSKSLGDHEELSTLLHAAQAGDERARNRLIEQYVPFILKVASQASRRYIDKANDDEYSVALSAMNEAIDRFDLSRASSFLSFAETIIRRRLIDYFRTQKSTQRQVPWSQFDIMDDEDNVTNFVEVKTSLEAHELREEQSLRVLEIEEYAKRLSEFHLSFAELVDISPKHEDARQNALAVSRIIVEDHELLSYVMERKSLPLKELEKRVAVSRKTMERQRKYILAIVILLTGDYPSLQSFVS